MFLDLQQSLINIGSFGLHILHGAFKGGFESVAWDMKKILKAAYTILRDTPTRRVTISA